MKKSHLFSILITALTILSCTDNVSVFDDVDQLSQEKYNRSYSDAFKIAQESISLVSSTTTRNGFGNREIDTVRTKAITLPITRNGSVENDTIIYVFNFKDDNGFALVSTSLATEGLLAVTEKGNYDPSQPSEIEGFNEFVELAEKYVKVATSERGLRPDPNEPEIYEDSVVISYAPVCPLSAYDPPCTQFNWGQDTPEGDFCSNNTAGCVNTAIGEIMMFYSYPTSIQLTYPGADKSMEILNWSNIDSHDPGFPIYDCSDTVTHNSIGRLVRQIGYMTDSYYYYNYNGYGVTGTDKEDIKPALQALGFTVDNWKNYQRNIIKYGMSFGYIYLVTGYMNSLDGHAWLLDHMIDKITTTYQLRWTGTGWVPTGVVNTTTSSLLHYNWGFYGMCNGYFSENVYCMSEFERLDPHMSSMTNGPSYNIGTQFLRVYH